MATSDTPLTRLPGRWIELRVTAPREHEDPLVALLHADGAIGARSSPAGPRRVRLSAWFERREQADRAIDRLAALEWAVLDEPPLRDVTDTGWLEGGAERSEPLRAGRFVVVESADGEAARRGAGEGLTLVVPRGRAFGTGEHATTSLCLEALTEAPRAPGSTVDLGTGSGILAIAAALDGRAPVLALDNDPAVLDVARANVRANAVADGVDVRGGSWTDLPRDGSVALLIANIHRTTLVRAAPRGVAALAPGARAVLSGFSPEDAPLVERAWRDAGAEAVRLRTRGAWAALEVARAG